MGDEREGTPSILEVTKIIPNSFPLRMMLSKGGFMSTSYLFLNRADAGQRLAAHLKNYHFKDAIVIALPRGGVPIAATVADELELPLDVLIVRKIGAPFNEEYGIGALSEDGVPLYRANGLLEEKYVTDEVHEIVQREQNELRRRIEEYRGGRPLSAVKNKTIILVDDGLATGATAAAAAKYLRYLGASKIILAVPVGPAEVSATVKRYIDEVICLSRPKIFSGVGMWYRDFAPVTDQEVLDIIHQFHPRDEDQPGVLYE